MEENRELLEQLLESKSYGKISKILKEMNPADIALFFEDIEIEDAIILFRLLPKETAADTFVEMDSDMEQALIAAFNDTELKAVIDELYLDDTVDIIEEMPANVVRRILKHSAPEMRESINEILNYPDDSAGSIMTIEFVDLRKDMTVAEAFEKIRNTGVDKETIYTCYVIDRNRHLEGVVSVLHLLISSRDEIIGNIMDSNVISANTLDDKEDVANQINKYNFMALPVVDGENRLVGIVTFDDAIDVIKEEATEDIQIMAAISPTDKPYLKSGVFEIWKKRIPWLLLLMVSATFTGKIIQSFESALAAQVILTAFIPMLMDTGGNAGGQASATIIRGLSLGDIEFRDWFRVVFKEMRVSLLCGVTLAVANFAKMMLLDRVGLMVSAVVCITLLSVVILAKFVGCSLPILAKKVGFDPAVMASPFITTIVDALSLMIYFSLAKALLQL
ncbi:MAG: magnesium transporter [Clostridiales bacterium]|nr:magnesium transporter [Clostridiales bacterium]